LHLSSRVLVAAVLFASAGCAGRSPEPVALVQPTDQIMDCAAISIEAQANNTKLQQLGVEEGSKVAQNVAAGVAGLFIWPLWFAMDFQDAAGKEVTAINARSQYLTVMAVQRNCGAPAPVIAQQSPSQQQQPDPVAAPPYRPPLYFIQTQYPQHPGS
jgi:hypothetical protein